ncbi:restriction endonuclease [Pseudomonas putida]|uniref:Restriction endonuclease type IV Mrr domain-containing protein n=1 Tax=Pseudomonas putida TaxID=303 RepID=A0A177SDV7_PSEPU|nr:restriction endonuclease [Pseudomonas putida]OAI86449.1 hypothetical protein AYO28_01790 [Pseudomonas putida]
MSLLDFSEIPPSKAPSADVDAFEKFAREFFAVLFNARVIKNVGRGPDGGADLVLEVEGERWLVSCKNYRNSVGRNDEEAPYGDMQQWGCQQFIGFYSPGPSTGLETKLRQTRDNNPGFRYQIFDSKEIQSRLICAGSSEAWLLAFRWFPGSFSKIASALVRPLMQHDRQDVVTDHGRSWIAGLPVYSSHAANDPQSRERAAEGLVSIANEIATGRAFSPIFIERIKDFCLAVPGAFLRPTYVSDEEVQARLLYPSWSLGLVRDLCARGLRRGLLNLCRVWSLWDLEMAETVYFYGRQLMAGDDHEFTEAGPEDIQTLQPLVAAHRTTMQFRRLAGELSFSSIVSHCSTTERGYFAALLCFGAVELYAFIPRQEALCRLAQVNGEQQPLCDALYRLVETFSEDDRAYVYAKSPDLLQLLTSVNYIDPDYVTKLGEIDPALTCLSATWVEAWRPAGQIGREIADALGFRP